MYRNPNMGIPIPIISSTPLLRCSLVPFCTLDLPAPLSLMLKVEYLLNLFVLLLISLRP